MYKNIICKFDRISFFSLLFSSINIIDLNGVQHCAIKNDSSGKKTNLFIFRTTYLFSENINSNVISIVNICKNQSPLLSFLNTAKTNSNFQQITLYFYTKYIFNFA